MSIRVGGDIGKPIVVTNPESATARAIREISESLAARISSVNLEAEDPTVQLEV
jgi:ATP-binding protein involved in chromosome partitioning